MKTIFAKYNRERLPQFQIVTKIVQLDDGSKKVFKHALNSQARGHIAEIFSNYTRLRQKYPHIKLVKPVLEDESTVSFSFASGVSFENLLKQALDNQDKDSLLALLNKFISYVDSFVDERQVKFVPCEKFTSVFGTWQSEEPQDIINLTNVDLIFSNLFLGECGGVTQIDYEWVFEFPIPVRLIFLRVLIPILNFNESHFFINQLQDLVLEIFGIGTDDTKECNEVESCFYEYVYGVERKYFLNINILKPRHFTFNELQNKEQELQNKEQELQYKEQELQSVLNSKSWKITLPFRRLSSLIKNKVYDAKYY